MSWGIADPCMFFVVKPLIIPAGKMRYCPWVWSRWLDIGQKKKKKRNDEYPAIFMEQAWSKRDDYMAKKGPYYCWTNTERAGGAHLSLSHGYYR